MGSGKAKIPKLIIALVLVAGSLGQPAQVGQAVSATDILGPTGSGTFGDVTLLSNGNFVVVDTGYDIGTTLNVGAVYLYNGETMAQISALTGSTASDQVGSGGVTVLSSGNFVVRSPLWDNGAATNAGAVTWCSATAGCSGVVSSANSLVGKTASDNVGFYSLVTLTTGNFVVYTSVWDNGAVTNAGAVTFCSGTSGCMGEVSSSNSMVGTTAGDGVGSGVTALPGGAYVVRSPNWDNGATVNAGAVTWCSGTTGCAVGAVQASASLVGLANNSVGSSVTVLANGSYVVTSTGWDNPSPVATNAGAATWCSGTHGCAGMTASASNSMAGSKASDFTGGTLKELSGGGFLLINPNWDNGTATNAGAVTWCSGTALCAGTINASNSLVGSTASDSVGNSLVYLANGSYVVRSYLWDNTGAADAGAVTWCSGTAGCTGAVGAANSLVGSQAYDNVGGSSSYVGVKELANGNYVVASYNWHAPGWLAVGEVTWCSGTGGCTGLISDANSLVGSTTGDGVGYGLDVLPNGSYVVRSPNWVNGTAPSAGAVTWCSGTAGCTGPVSAANSLVGSSTSDVIGIDSVTILGSSGYVVSSRYWDNGGTLNNAKGAATWCSSTGSCNGLTVSAANSLVGTSASDWVGSNVTALTGGGYVVNSIYWDNGGTLNNAKGAATWCSGTGGCTGAVSSSNSLVGSIAGDEVGEGGVIALANGSYVVSSPGWNGTAVTAGAVTWCSGTGGCTGAVSSSNSLVGSIADDSVGIGGVIALDNGSYVVKSLYWDNGPVANAGAVTWCSAMGGCTGPVSAANSLIGSTAYDAVGDVLKLSGGSYVVISSSWDNWEAAPVTADVGAVTWCSGTADCSGPVSAANSLIGSTASDGVGNSGNVTALASGNYQVVSPTWDNGALVDAGAVTYGSGWYGISGPVSAANSMVGGAASSGSNMVQLYDSVHNQFIISLRGENRLQVFIPDFHSIASGNWGSASTWDFGAIHGSTTGYIMPGHTVILAPDASLGAAKVVTVGSGVLRKEMDSGHPSFIFPLGDAANSSPAAVDCTGSSFAPGAYISATVTAEAFSGRPAGPDYLNRTWVITQSGLTNINCATLFQYVPGDVTGTEANLYGLKSHNSLLTDLGPVDTVNHTFGGTVTEFSTFTAGSSAPTAVTLTNIDLQASGAGLLLHWQTAQEVDLVGFQVERSASPDGQPQPISAFMPVQNPGSLEGADYSYLDTPLKFAQTYRYWIVIFSAGGTQQQIGPFSAQAGGQVYLPVIVK